MTTGRVRLTVVRPLSDVWCWVARVEGIWTFRGDTVEKAIQQGVKDGVSAGDQSQRSRWKVEPVERVQKA
jgi:hypothetical protein